MSLIHTFRATCPVIALLTSLIQSPSVSLSGEIRVKVVGEKWCRFRGVYCEWKMSWSSRDILSEDYCEPFGLTNEV